MKKAKRILCMLVVLVLVFSLFACDKTVQSENPGSDTQDPLPTESDSPGASKPSAIAVGVSGWLGRFLDTSSPPPNLSACNAVYDTIFLIDRVTKEPYSLVLSDWGYVDDLTFVMTLKPGITFSNGDEATAEDLLFSVLRHFEMNSNSTRWIGPIDTENCTSDGEYTVTIKYKEPYGPGIYITYLYLFDKSWCEEVGWESQDWFSNPNGSGPYKVTEYVTDDHITLTLKDNYWNAANERFDVESWYIRYYPEASTMMMALEKGDISMCAVGNIADYERWLSQNNQDIGMYMCSMGGNMLFNLGFTNNEIFNDIRVREALAYGVDWEAIGRLVRGELYVPPTSSLTEDSPFYLNVGSYQYDPERAKQILADTGYTESDLKIHMYESGGEPSKSMSEALQYYCKEMGITLDLEFGDVTSALSVWLSEGGSDAGWYSYINGSINSEPHHTYTGLYNKGFTWQYCDDEVLTELGLGALRAVDQTERKRLYHELQQYIYDNYLMYPVYESTSVVGYRTEVFTEDEIARNVYSGSFYALHGLSLAE